MRHLRRLPTFAEEDGFRLYWIHSRGRSETGSVWETVRPQHVKGIDYLGGKMWCVHVEEEDGGGYSLTVTDWPEVAK